MFTEVEGMTELNGHAPIEICNTRAYDFKLKLDTSNFGAYTRQGIVENKKVPHQISFKSLGESIKNPAASSKFGMLEMPDLKLFGRSE